jgi:hypothetical protein
MTLCIQIMIPHRGGLPHSDTHGSKPARGSPWLFAACHVLHRLLAPRHPPDALLILKQCSPGSHPYERSPQKTHAQKPPNPPGLNPASQTASYTQPLQITLTQLYTNAPEHCTKPNDRRYRAAHATHYPAGSDTLAQSSTDIPPAPAR